MRGQRYRSTGDVIEWVKLLPLPPKSRRVGQAGFAAPTHRGRAGPIGGSALEDSLDPHYKTRERWRSVPTRRKMGAVPTLPEDESVFWSLVTPSGGEVVGDFISANQLIRPKNHPAAEL